MSQLKQRLYFKQTFRTAFKNYKIYFVGVLLVMMSGCQWFNNDKKTAIEEEIETVAPTASFTISASTGKAALTVNFTDTSSAGSSAITSWSWNFGDGGSSNQQNPQYIYETAGIFDVSLTVTADGSDTFTQTSAVTVEAADSITKITVVDEKGLTLDAVVATSQIFTIESQVTNASTQLVVNMRPSETQGVIRLQKAGYLDALLYLENSTFSSTRVVTMLKQLPAIIINGSMGGEFIGVDGASVNIPPQAFAKPDGTTVLGEIELFITPVDIENEITANAFPGSFFGLPNADEIPVGEDPQQQLVSYGVANYSFFADGEELQLRQDLLADLELPIYADKNLYGDDMQLGESIPLWTLDETSGIWIQQGVGVIVANPSVASGFSLRAQTSHFSWFNIDAWSSYTPPGAADSGSGGGKGTCLLNLTVTGANATEPVGISLQSRNSRVRKTIIDGILNGPIPRGVNVTATATQGERAASTSFICADNQDSIQVTLVLELKAPEFIFWSVDVQPVFSRATPSSNYEVSANTIKVGGHFVGTNSVAVNTSLLDGALLALLDQQFYELDFTMDDDSPNRITATLINEVDSTQIITDASYLETSAPILNYMYAYEDQETLDQNYSWEVAGADTGAVYFLGLNPSAVGTLVFQFPQPEIGTFISNLLAGQEGFIRIEFTNQYGTTETVVRLNQPFCDLNSDLPCDVPQL